MNNYTDYVLTEENEKLQELLTRDGELQEKWEWAKQAVKRSAFDGYLDVVLKVNGHYATVTVGKVNYTKRTINRVNAYTGRLTRLYMDVYYCFDLTKV